MSAPFTVLAPLCALLPLLSYGVLALLYSRSRGPAGPAAAVLQAVLAAHVVLALIGVGLVSMQGPSEFVVGAGWGRFSALSAWLGLLVHSLALVIGSFAWRYLERDRLERLHIRAFAIVLAGVQALLLADHWLILIAAWSLVGRGLEPLLCFYPDRPFARLAAHKKRIADRAADLALVLAALLAWRVVGSGSLSELIQHLESNAASPAVQVSGLLVALAVILRTACLPVHGWLIQVMEAPTPVSALLHAGVVNLGGFVLIRLAPLLEAAPAARWLLVVMGLLTAILAGLVMMTRVSIKVRLAWSTAAQMGFMVLECGLGLYTIATLHLIGHSLYKAHAFLAASSAVRDTRIQSLWGRDRLSFWSLLLAPGLTGAVLMMMGAAQPVQVWPLWWILVLALAWAPLLWLPRLNGRGRLIVGVRALGALVMVIGLSILAFTVHRLPLGVVDAPFHAAGWVAVMGMGLFHLMTAAIALNPLGLATARRWAYAGFYLDEFLTRLALRIGAPRWVLQPTRAQARPDLTHPS